MKLWQVTSLLLKHYNNINIQRHRALSFLITPKYQRITWLRNIIYLEENKSFRTWSGVYVVNLDLLWLSWYHSWLTLQYDLSRDISLYLLWILWLPCSLLHCRSRSLKCSQKIMAFSCKENSVNFTALVKLIVVLSTA